MLVARQPHSVAAGGFCGHADCYTPSKGVCLYASLVCARVRKLIHVNVDQAAAASANGCRTGSIRRYVLHTLCICAAHRAPIVELNQQLLCVAYLVFVPRARARDQTRAPADERGACPRAQICRRHCRRRAKSQLLEFARTCSGARFWSIAS